ARTVDIARNGRWVFPGGARHSCCGRIDNMDKLIIRGGNPLIGTVRVSGAKNAALPAMAAALLTEEPVILENIPAVRDIETERRLLVSMGAEVELGYGRAHHRTTICARILSNP